MFRTEDKLKDSASLDKDLKRLISHHMSCQYSSLLYIYIYTQFEYSKERRISEDLLNGSLLLRPTSNTM